MKLAYRYNKPHFRVYIALSFLLSLTGVLNAQNTQIDISTTNTTPTKGNITGYNNGDYRKGYNLIQTEDYVDKIDELNLGWFRWYSGTVSNSFYWKIGNHDPEKKAQIIDKQGYLQYNKFARIESMKGYNNLKEYYDIISDLGLNLIITLNAMTSTLDEVVDLAKYCYDHDIQVDAWQLGNEPHLLSGSEGGDFFEDAEDYLNKMKDYDAAIKNKIPGAKTYVFYATRPFNTSGSEWNAEIKAYQDTYGRFWDGVCFHSYDGSNSDDTIAKKVLSANSSLNDLDDKIAEVISKSFVGAPMLTTEFNTRIQTASGWWFGMYDGIYLAEATLRLANHDNFQMIGRSRTTPGNIDVEVDYRRYVVDKWENGGSYDSNAVDHGFYFSPAAHATSMVDLALNNSSLLLETSVSNSSQVDTLDTGVTMDAIYAQAFRGNFGGYYLCVTNKSSSDQTVDINLDSSTIIDTVEMKSITASSPDARNGALTPDAITPTTTTIYNGGSVTIPKYSVVLFTWGSGDPSLKPVKVYAREFGSNSLTIHWPDSPYADGYDVEWWLEGSASVSSVDAGDVNAYTISSLTPEDKYEYTVTPYYINSLSQKVYGPTSDVRVAKIKAPRSPEISRLYPIRNNSIIVEWESRIRANEYILKYGTSSGSLNTSVNVGTATAYTLDDVLNNQTYYFAVAASNGMGTSSDSSEASVTYPVDSSSIPWAGVNLQASATSGSVDLFWEKPLSISEGWYFEDPNDVNDWVSNAAGSFSRVTHPDNGGTPSAGDEPRDTYVWQALGEDNITRAYTGSTTMGDYLVSLQVEMDESWTSDDKIWVFARYQNANKFYRFGVDYPNQELLLQVKDGAGNLSTLTSQSFSNAFGSGVPPLKFTFGIRVEGDRIIGYWNDSPLLEASDSTFSTGPIAISIVKNEALVDKIELFTSHMEGASYEVWRSNDPRDNYSLLTTVTNGTTNYTDSSVSSGQTYYYKIRGLNQSLESRDFSNIRTVRVP